MTWHGLTLHLVFRKRTRGACGSPVRKGEGATTLTPAKFVSMTAGTPASFSSPPDSQEHQNGIRHFIIETTTINGTKVEWRSEMARYPSPGSRLFGGARKPVNLHFYVQTSSFPFSSILSARFVIPLLESFVINSQQFKIQCLRWFTSPQIESIDFVIL